KLVAQDAGDEPASELLKRIRVEKDRLIAGGKIKKDKPLAAIAEGEAPFELPVGWEWVRWADIAMKIGDIDHKMPSEVSEGVPYISPRDFYGKNEIDFAGAKKIAPVDYLNLAAKIRPEKGDLIYPRYGTIGVIRMVMDDREFLASYSCAVIKVLRGCIEPSYQYLFSMSDCVKRQAASATNKTTQPNVGLKSIQEYLVPLPPLAEQSRIVTRVEELMRLCDALEAKGRLEAAQHAQLVTTLLGTLTQSDTPAQLAENWQRLATHFALLLDRPQAVDALEQTILQLAVRGLLVPQDPTDEPASALLKKIRLEKDRLIAAGQIKRDKPLAAIGEEEQPFGLPVGWEWVPIETLANVGSGTTPSRENAAFFVGGSIPWVTSGETGKLFIGETAQHVTELALAQTSLSVYPKGTLIVAMYGQGKTRGQVSELCIEATTNQACAAIVLVESAVAHRCFVKLVFEKSYDEMRELSAGGAQPNLNVGKIKATLIPLPPLPEQSRIVTRVAQLRRLCADLRQRLSASQSTQAQLAEALVENVA
ncbi:MAG: restriction endonuclease subunit S, partial [Rhodoferax sp.]|nr:restriction endonuclease subunit S [Rhodoferax sp.]